jgi:hypothetical protein
LRRVAWALAFVLLFPTVAQARHGYPWDGGLLHWADRSILVVDALPHHHQMLRQAVKRWGWNSALRFRVVRGPRGPCSEAPQGIIRVQQCPNPGPNVGNVRFAWGDAPHIVGALAFFGYDAWHYGRGFDRHIICHEMGHALGLGHRGGESCMHDRTDYPFPDAHDFRVIHRPPRLDSATLGGMSFRTAWHGGQLDRLP